MVMEMSEEKWKAIESELIDLLIPLRDPLAYPNVIHSKAWRIIGLLRTHSSAWSHLARRKPRAIAAAILYLAAQSSNVKVRQLELCSVLQISQPCLADNIRLIRIYIANAITDDMWTQSRVGNGLTDAPLWGSLTFNR